MQLSIYLGALVLSLTATALAQSETMGYFGVHGGIHTRSSAEVEGGQVGVFYGRNVSKQSYKGGFEIGYSTFFDRDELTPYKAGLFPITYSYEFMREASIVSFGIDTTLGLALLYDKAKKTKKDKMFLGAGGGLGIFAKSNISKSTSVLIRTGVMSAAKLNFDSFVNPYGYILLSIRYHY